MNEKTATDEASTPTTPEPEEANNLLNDDSFKSCIASARKLRKTPMRAKAASGEKPFRESSASKKFNLFQNSRSRRNSKAQGTNLVTSLAVIGRPQKSSSPLKGNKKQKTPQKAPPSSPATSIADTHNISGDSKDTFVLFEQDNPFEADSLETRKKPAQTTSTLRKPLPRLALPRVPMSTRSNKLNMTASRYLMPATRITPAYKSTAEMERDFISSLRFHKRPAFGSSLSTRK